MPDPDARDGHALMALFLRAEGAERNALLEAIQKCLPARIRVYDNSGLAVYFDSTSKTPLPSWLAHPANYIEKVLPDGTAEVVKGGFGSTTLKTTTEPKIKTSWERLLEDDDL
jgi:hypothetical protein